MLYWERLVKSVINKNPVSGYSFSHSDKSQSGKRAKPTQPRKRGKSYFLGEKFPGVFLTQREAECMVHLLKGKTVVKVALALQLSPRTVEFYLKKMKHKLNCRTKSELLEKISESGFMRILDTVMPIKE